MTGRTPFLALICSLCLALALPAGADEAAQAAEAADRAAYVVLRDAKLETTSTLEQAEVLARHAWLMPEQSRAVRHMARRDLVGYGEEAIEVMVRIFDEVTPSLQLDVAAALVETQLARRGAPPNQYFAALEAVLWDGSVAARRVTLYPLGTFRWTPAMIPLIDTAHEFPVLRPLVIETLRNYADHRTVLFLRRMLASGSDEERELAALTLQAIVPAGVSTLRDFLTHNDPRSRTAAASALLPVADEDDLAVLYEYLELHGEADRPEIVSRVSRRVEQLEDRIREELADELASEGIAAGG